MSNIPSTTDNGATRTGTTADITGTDAPRRQRLTRKQFIRALGALLGSAIGDALGAPFEFGPAGRYSEKFPFAVIGGQGEMTGGGSFGWAPGEYTDDTQMAMCIAESLIALGRFDAEDMWKRFKAWSRTAPDVGINTRAVLSHDSREGAAEKGHRATGGRSASNGCVMRISPVAVYGSTVGPEETVRIAIEQAAMTHFDPAAAAGAAIVAEIIRRIIIDGKFDGVPSKVVADLIEQNPAGLGAAIAAYAPLVADTFDPHGFTGPGNGSVWTTVAQAVWAVRTTSSFEDAMRAVIDLGGDTDTVAAVAGAIAGAVHGIQRIPVRWTTHVNGTVTRPDGTIVHLDQADLVDVARGLVGKDPAVRNPAESAQGPLLVHEDGVFAANLNGAQDSPPDHAVVSLCLTGGRFAGRSHRREVYIIDKEGDANDDLMFVVREAVDAIDAFLAEGREVVVHCHGGRSRTGLVLKAWHMRRHGTDHRAAHDWLEKQWDLYATYNATFRAFLEGEWTQHVAMSRGGGN